MQRARVASIGAMGEEVHFGGQCGQGIVNDMRSEPRLVHGGESKGLSFTVEVSLEWGNAIADGDLAEIRGEKGRVVSKEHFGAGWMIGIGPVNRAADGVPGLD